MERLSHVYDCTNNLIIFDQLVSDNNNNLIKLSIEQYAKAVKTLSAPAIIIESNNDRRTRYYFRAICWDKTILIGVNFSNGIWNAKEYFENPSGAFVLALLKKNLLAGGIKLIQQNEIVDKNMG